MPVSIESIPFRHIFEPGRPNRCGMAASGGATARAGSPLPRMACRLCPRGAGTGEARALGGGRRPIRTAVFFGEGFLTFPWGYVTMFSSICIIVAHTINMLYRGTIKIPAESVLIAFESAARNGSFSRAARELQISRSAVRNRIAALEKQLTIQLFERSRSGLSLTEPGRRFHDAVVAALCVIENGVAEVANHSDTEQSA